MTNTADSTSLADTLNRFDCAYLLTVGNGKQAHAVATYPRFVDDLFVLSGLGNRSHAQINDNPLATLLWQPRKAGDYSLIIDGEVAPSGDNALVLTPTRAVLHRPGSSPEPGSPCASDCVELSLT